LDTLFQEIASYLESLFFYRLPFFPENIRVSLFVILFCIISAVEIYLFLFGHYVRDFRNKKLDKSWKDTISDMLTSIIINGEEENGVGNTVNAYLSRFQKLPVHRKRVRTILVDEIKVYHSNFTGFTSDVLRELFLRLDLHKYSLKKIKSNYWEIQVEGIREISQFWLTEYHQLIFELTDHEHEIVRMEAQAAYVKLDKENPFKFLNSLRSRLLPWHQLVLFEIITKAQNVKIPQFGQWLKSLNDSIVLFSLKLISHFQQLDALDEIIILLKHPNEEIRIQAVQVIGKLEAEFVEPIIYEHFFNDTPKVQVEIIRSIGKISSGNYFDFLKSCLDTEEFELKMAAMKAILAHGKKGKTMLEVLREETHLQNREIIVHVLDRRI